MDASRLRGPLLTAWDNCVVARKRARPARRRAPVAARRSGTPRVDLRRDAPAPLSSPPPPAAASDVAGAAPAPQLVEERGLPLVRELSRIATSSEVPIVKLEGALEVLFGAFGEADHEFSGLVLTGWMRAREEKQSRL